MNIWKNRTWQPMLLKRIDKPFNSDDYLFEIKYDGIRAIVFASQKEVKIQSRNQKDLTYLFPEMQEIKNIVSKNVIFDGEIVVMENGISSFTGIQKRIHLKNERNIKQISLTDPVVFICFDILYENKDLTNLPLLKRKEILNKYPDIDSFIKIKEIEKEGIKLFNAAKKLNLEGIVAKKKKGKYYIDKRTDDFIKIKIKQTEKFIIGGFAKKKNNILSLAIGSFINGDFHYAGNVSLQPNASIYNLVKKQKLTKNYFVDFKDNINYIKPHINILVEYLEKTKKGHLRHPIYKEG